MQPKAGEAHRLVWPPARVVPAAAVLGVLMAMRMAAPGAPTAAVPADLAGRAAVGYGVTQELYPSPPATPAPPPAPPPSTPPPVQAAPVKAVLRAPTARHPAVSTGAVSSTAAPVAQTLSLLNADRASGGVAPLRLDAALSRAAAVHVAAQAAQDAMFHDGYVADVNAQGVSWHGLAEVLGTWRPTPDIVSINTMWMQSSEHRPLIMNASYVAVGIAWARSSNGDWFVDVILEY